MNWRIFVYNGRKKELPSPDDINSGYYSMMVILDPVLTTYSFLAPLVRAGCHLFLTEKLSMTTSERRMLVDLAQEGNTLIQLRNNLLFHPAQSELVREFPNSQLIEIHHTVPGHHAELQEMLFSNFLMIVRIANSEPKSLNICSIPSNGYLTDVLNLYLTFNNGSAASLTLSFIGKRKEHNLSVFSGSGVINYNFEENKGPSALYDSKSKSSLTVGNKLLIRQIEYFISSVSRNVIPYYSLMDEMRVFQLVEKVNRKLEPGSVLN